ncbi:helix-turn-helix transcriptional regulator [Nitratireductor sp. GISD-1A_MAKvit]|uniref:helix-turn-helix transcriptional regulator n=1 Tax=Nitratireductor sp. GISD-1A_MAKvit TaxID=3234198 RepID=UPI003465D443
MSFDSFARAASKKPHLKLAFARVEGARRMADTLAGLRQEARLTQKQLGKILGVSQARISQVESGLLDHAPSIDFACAFAAACGGRLEFHAGRDRWPQLGTELEQAASALAEAFDDADFFTDEDFLLEPESTLKSG